MKYICVNCGEEEEAATFNDIYNNGKCCKECIYKSLWDSETYEKIEIFRPVPIKEVSTQKEYQEEYVTKPRMPRNEALSHFSKLVADFFGVTRKSRVVKDREFYDVEDDYGFHEAKRMLEQLKSKGIICN